MVDFELLGRITVQRDMIVALCTHQTHRRIGVVVKDLTQARETGRQLYDKIQDVANRVCEITYKGNVPIITLGTNVKIEFFLHDRVNAFRGREFDLLWLRWAHWEESDIIGPALGSVRKGYNPLILFGDTSHILRHRWGRI